jgi:hypothetical protein
MAAVVLAAALLGSWPVGGHAAPPADRLAVLSRGVNITNWFRYPARTDDAALRTYLSDPALVSLRRVGFGFIRLAVQPELFDADQNRVALLVEVVRRIQRQGIAVILVPFPTTWRLEDSAADRARLLSFWHRLALELRPLDPRLIYPEVLNEPVFSADPQFWSTLQRAVLAVIRSALPDATVVLTGADWGGIDGLVKLDPVADTNVVYSVHFYEPQELTALAAYRSGLDRAAFARLPFPMNPDGCAAAARGATDEASRDLITFTCGLHWDAARIEARIGGLADWAHDHHVTILLGEFGATRQLNTTARLAWLAAVRQSCERHEIGWALWGYDDVMGFGVDPRKPENGHLDPGVLAALGLDSHP